MTGLDELRVSWTALAAGPGTGGHTISTLPLEDEADGGTILVGRDLNGRRHLLIPAGEDTVGEDTSSDAVHLESLELGEERSRFADLVLRDPKLADVFDDMIIAVLRRIEDGDSDAIDVCASVLGTWRALLRPPSREPLNVRQMAGLAAELHTAIELLRRDPGRRLDVWTGPTGARHDFRRGPNAIEVKATLSQGEPTTEIHGLDQLLAPEGGELHLIWVRLERVPDGDVSVAGLVEQLRKLIGGSPGLYQRLTEKGWRPDTAAEQVEFEIRERRAYAVTERFPRLTPAELSSGSAPPGVRNVRYEIALDGATGLDDAALDSLFESVATAEAGE